MDAKTQLQEVRERLAQLDPNNRDNLVDIALLKTREAELLNQVAQDEVEQAHEQRVTQSVETFDVLMDQVELKKYVGEGPEYTALKIKLKRVYMAQVDESSQQLKDANLKFSDQLRAFQDREMQLQRQNDSLQERLAEEQNKNLQTTLELQDAIAKRDAAAAELDEANKQIKQLESWNQDLREQAAFGVKGSLTVIDDEETKRQEAELEAQRLKERTIYGMEWSNDLKKTHYKAYRAIDGQKIEFPFYEKTKYNVIEETEVSQFRSQYNIQYPAIEVHPVAQEPVSDNVAQEQQFPVQPPGMPSIAHPMAKDTSELGGSGNEAQVTRAELETRLARFAQDHGLVKGAVA